MKISIATKRRIKAKYHMKVTRHQHKFLLFSICLFLAKMVEAQEESEDKLVAKGRGFVSLSFSLDQREAENENQLIRNVLDQDKLNLRVGANGGYAIKDNFVLGLAFGYGRNREDILQLNQDNEEIFVQTVGQEFTFTPNMRNYIPLGEGTFQVFVQTDVRLNFGESLRRTFLEQEQEKLESQFFESRIGVSPGMVIFFDRNWAFETSVGLVGLTSRWTRQTLNNDIDNQTRIVENNINLRLNLLALNLGVARYF